MFLSAIIFTMRFFLLSLFLVSCRPLGTFQPLASIGGCQFTHRSIDAFNDCFRENWDDRICDSIVLIESADTGAKQFRALYQQCMNESGIPDLGLNIFLQCAKFHGGISIKETQRYSCLEQLNREREKLLRENENWLSEWKEYRSPSSDLN